MATKVCDRDMMQRLKKIRKEEERLLAICDFKISDEVVWNAEVQYCPIPYGNGVIVDVNVFDKTATVLWRKGKFGRHKFNQLKKTGRNIPEILIVLETIDSLE